MGKICDFSDFSAQFYFRWTCQRNDDEYYLLDFRSSESLSLRIAKKKQNKNRASTWIPFVKKRNASSCLSFIDKTFVQSNRNLLLCTYENRLANLEYVRNSIKPNRKQSLNQMNQINWRAEESNWQNSSVLDNARSLDPYVRQPHVPNSYSRPANRLHWVWPLNRRSFPKCDFRRCLQRFWCQYELLFDCRCLVGSRCLIFTYSGHTRCLHLFRLFYANAVSISWLPSHLGEMAYLPLWWFGAIS